MRHRIWRVKDGNLTDRNGAWLPYITYYEPKSKEEIVGPVTETDDATLEELVELCDRGAENCNAHDFCGSHRLLGSLLHRHVGRKMATEIMLDIAMYGGQHGMGGVCTVGHAYGDLNVGEINHDWDGEYPA